MTVPQILHRPDRKLEVVCPRPGCTVEPVVTGFIDVARAAAKRHICNLHPAPTTGGDAA